MKIKIILIIALSTVLMACTHKPLSSSTPVEISLTEAELAQWLSHQSALMLISSKEEQAKAYFTEQFLLDRKQLLNTNTMNKLHFLKNVNAYQKSYAIHKKKIASEIEVPSDAYDKKFTELKNKVRKPERIRLYQIFKRYPPNSTEESKKILFEQMLSIKEKAAALDQFKRLAESESDSQSRLKKGLIGNVYRGLLAPELANIVFKMQAGEISEVIKTEKGLMVFYCEKRIAAVVKSTQELQEMAHTQVKNKLFAKRWNDFKNQMKNTEKYEYNQGIFNNDNEKLWAAKVGDERLSLEQLSWLMNLSNSSQLEQINHNKINKNVESYGLHKAMYKALGDESKVLIEEQMLYDHKNKVAKQVLVKLINDRLIKPNETEIKQHYENNKEHYIRDDYYAISGLAYRIIKGQRLDAYNKMERILYEIKEEKISFSDAANRYSEFSSRYKDGYLGSFSRQNLPSALGLNLLKVILKSKPGHVSDLVETDSGYIWIIKVDSLEPSRVMTFDESKALIENELGNMKIKQLEAEVTDEMFEGKTINLIN